MHPRMVRDFDACDARSMGNNSMHARKVVIVGSCSPGILLLFRLPDMPLAPYPREAVADFRGPVLTNTKDTMCWRERIANEEHTA
jgi:hypothetical protein